MKQTSLFDAKPKLEPVAGSDPREWFVSRIRDFRHPVDRVVAGPFESYEAAKRAIDEGRITCL